MVFKGSQQDFFPAQGTLVIAFLFGLACRLDTT
jgi:hypothetical protein